MRYVALLLTLSLVLGCNGVKFDGAGKKPAKAAKRKKKPKKKKKLGPVPKTKWGTIGNNYLKFEADKALGTKYGSEVRISMYQGKLKFDPVKMPKGTIIEAEGEKFVEKGEYKELVIDVTDRLIDEPWTTFQGRLPTVDWKVPFKVTLPGRKPVKETTQPLSVGYVIGAYFKGLTPTSAVHKWPGEKTAPEPIPKAAVWTFGSFDALGEAPKARDVRWVAIVTTELNGKTRKCGGYIGVSHVTVNAYDATVHIADRYTGQVMKEKTFKGGTRCPRSVYAKAGEKVVRQSGPDTGKMKKWVKGQLRRLPTSL